MSTHYLGSPILSIICQRKLHSTWSYALLMSNFTAMCLIFPFRQFCIRCNISKATEVLSVISLFGTKVLWASKMTFGRIIFNRLAITFETILDTTFARLMGRYSLICLGLFFLGMSTMWARFILCGHHPECKTDNTADVTSGPMMCQNFWNKYGDMLLGPGDLDGCIWKRATLNSSLV